MDRKIDLSAIFGNIDIYIFDQLLKGRFDTCHKILDAGCGHGRNLHYFIQNQFEVYGVDLSISAIEELKKTAKAIAPETPQNNFLVAPVEEIPFENNFFDLVISSAVLHFARDKAHFESMLFSMWRVLKPQGFLFVRLASSIGIEKFLKATTHGRFLLPDGSERYLINESDLLHYTHLLQGIFYEPIKTTNVQNLRCMTTWCIQKT